MVDMKHLQERLDQIGCKVDFWGSTELRELAAVLTPNEQIASVINGMYEGGFALLCITDYRVILVDKKPLTLTVEDLRYDMIAEVDYAAHVFLSSLHIFTPMRTLIFSSWNRRRLQNAMSYVQRRLLEIRNRQSMIQRAVEAGTASEFNRGYAAGVAQQTLDPLPAKELLINSIDRADPATITNPYTKAPMLSRRRRYPSFYSA